jgi:hypothetical protein
VRAVEVNPRLGEFRVGVCLEQRSLNNPLIAAFWNAMA